jgi:hypothetical protein
MSLAPGPGMSNPFRSLLRRTEGESVLEYVLLTAAIGFGVAGAIASGRTAVNAKVVAIGTSIAVTSPCRPPAPGDDPTALVRRCAAQSDDERRPAR